MKREIIGYSSVKGKLHEQKRLPNQDSYTVKRYKFGTVLVVADGMGAHSHSDIGSKAVCNAVCKAIQLWEQTECRDIRLLLPLIHSLWGINIYPNVKKECGTTCLFAYVSKDSMLYLGQLGDGNVYISIDEKVELLKIKEDDFSNFTFGMSGINSFNEWSLRAIDITNKRLKICMMTDGVSETLIEETKEQFVKTVWKKVAECENTLTRNALIYRMLENWNSINAGDDRTLVSYEKI